MLNMIYKFTVIGIPYKNNEIDLTIGPFEIFTDIKEIKIETKMEKKEKNRSSSVICVVVEANGQHTIISNCEKIVNDGGYFA